jgi:hypothetical protein
MIWDNKIGKDVIRSCRSLDPLWFPALSIGLDTIIQAGHWTEMNNKVGVNVHYRTKNPCCSLVF